ncbi:MAG: PQQ-dependent sugar dehydrogenase [Actinobacteria bacterium]|nr:PQQ-dependent sugar dehydrogenase [Actinomycetota bacterium]
MRGWFGSRRRGRVVVGIGLLGVPLFAAACVPPQSTGTAHIDVTFDKTPARGTTNVTVSVVNFSVTNVTVSLDSATAMPIETATNASFQFPLDTTPLADGPHTLFLTANGPTGSTQNTVAFGVDNSQTTLPTGFQQSTVFNRLNQPTAVKFASDGRVFVAEKAGVVKVFDSISDTTPKIFADLRTEVYSAGDRGLLGLALDPNFPTKPYVYVLYSRDAPLGGTPPVFNDMCSDSTNGCVISARLARLKAAGDAMTGSEEVLVDGWCQQFASHSIGTIAFGADGALYAGGGDGANWLYTDYGQAGSPPNPCGDPPVGVGGTQTAPTAAGGALRAQSLLTTANPVSLDGSIIRVNPDTGAAMPDNPNAASTDPNRRRIVAMGLRNPYRFTVRPGTNELWIGDVGCNMWEEIDRVANPTASVTNFGWPCYEGNGQQPGYSALNLNICNALYASGTATPPYYTYQHTAMVVPGDGCAWNGGSSISGGSFYNGGSFPGVAGNYPSKYDGALFFADYTRRCIWAMLKGSNGLPDPTKIEAFASGTAGAYSPVDLVTGPGGDLYYVDLVGGTIRRIRYYAGNRPPAAEVRATPSNGPLPLTVNFDASASTDPDADPMTYSWDLNGDGTFGDAAGAKVSYTYSTPGVRTVSVRVSDPYGASSVATVQVSPGNTAPVATIITPSPTLNWTVGQSISFSGSATDAEDGTLPPSAFTWSLDIRHCPSVDTCHTHPVQTWTGVSSGSFIAPDHEYPSHLELWLTVTDSGGLTDTKLVELYAQTSTLTVQSNPPGANIGVGSIAQAAPFTLTVITGSTQSVVAPNQTVNGTSYVFKNWSDGLAQSHQIVVNADTTVTATFQPG